MTHASSGRKRRTQRMREGAQRCCRHLDCANTSAYSLSLCIPCAAAAAPSEPSRTVHNFFYIANRISNQVTKHAPWRDNLFSRQYGKKD